MWLYINFLYAIVFLTIGFGLQFWVERRKFYRRNEAWVEEFENFRSAVWSGILEKIVGFIGWAFVILGALFVLMFIIRLFSWK